MRSFGLLLLFVVTTACGQNTKDPEAFRTLWTTDAASYGLTEGFLKATQNTQADLIARFTGAKPIQPGVTINRRYDEAERDYTRAYLKLLLDSLGLDWKAHDYHMTLEQLNKQQNPAIGTNLYAVIPATSPSDEYILLGAHLDTVEESPGASDNASGCAMVYGVARAMLQQKNRNQNLLIVFLDKEEIGHAGAIAFADFLIKEKWKVTSVHTADQVGWDQDGDRNIELELPTKTLKKAYQKAAEGFDIKLYSTRESGSDHKDFRNAGFPSVGITEEYRKGDTSPFHHHPEDKIETIDFEYLSFVTYLVFKTVELLANED